MPETDLPPPPPEAVLIRERREAQFPRLSMRRAAIDAGISPSSWAEVETARKTVAPGVMIYRKGTPEMVAPMAASLGITAAELRAAGREDAARALAAMAGHPAFSAAQRRTLASRVKRDTANG
jgi:hypothetical protein